MNGYLAEETVGTVAEIVPLMQEAIAHFSPGSSYARALGVDLLIRGKKGGRKAMPDAISNFISTWIAWWNVTEPI